MNMIGRTSRDRCFAMPQFETSEDSRQQTRKTKLIQAALRAQPYIIPTFLAVSVLLSFIMWLIRKPTGRDRILSVLFAISVSAVLAITATPNAIRGQFLGSTCSASLNVQEMLSSQGILNATLFVPPTLFGVLLFGYPLSSFSAALLLSVSIELLQFSFPSIGRSCDLIDVSMNSLGALAGTILGLAASKHIRHLTKNNLARQDRKRGDFLASTIMVVASTLILILIPTRTTPLATDSKADNIVLNSAQSTVIRRAVAGLLGDNAEISGITLRLPQSAELDPILDIRSGRHRIDFSWPRLEAIRGIFNEDPITPPGIAGNTAPEKIATSYVAQNFPWALAETKQFTYALDTEKGEYGIGWRKHANGILMPLRMDVFFDSDRRLIGFLARNLTPPKLPKVLINKEKARSIARKKREGKVFGMDLRAVQSGDVWAVQWMVQVGNRRPNESAQENPLDYILINANDGSIM